MNEIHQLFDTHLSIFYLAIGLLGLCVGSFLNVVIYRMPKMMEQEWRSEAHAFLQLDPPDVGQDPITLSRPASRCPHCGHRIRWYENIPLVSWILLRGRCSRCTQAISWRYPFVELATAFASIAVAVQFGVTIETGAGLVLTWILITLTGIDFDTQLLPDRLTYSLLGLGLAVNSYSLFATPVSSIWGALLGFLSLWLVYILFKLVTGKVGMGHGDFKLLAALGAWLGAVSLPLIVLLSSVVGAVLGIILMKRNQASQPFAFGPFLAIAGWITFMWGDTLMHYWLG